jgi:hypothetical protein
MRSRREATLIAPRLRPLVPERVAVRGIVAPE